MTSDEPAADDVPAEVGARGTFRGIALAAVLLAAAGAVLWFVGYQQLYAITMLAAAAGLILYTAVARRGDTVLADRDGVVITTRGRPVRYPWAELLEVGWISPEWPYHGAGIVIRPAAGGPWEIPGPNNPTQVATLPVFGRAGHRRARALLGQQCRAHGVPFDENGRRLLLNGPPGSPYRKSR